MTGSVRWINMLLAVALAMVLGAAVIPQQWVGFGLCLGATGFVLGWGALLNRVGTWVVCSVLELLILVNAYLHYHRAILARF